MYCFPMLSEAYSSALLASDEGTPKPSENGAVVDCSRSLPKDPVDAPAEEEDLETARTLPLRRDSLHL